MCGYPKANSIFAFPEFQLIVRQRRKESIVRNFAKQMFEATRRPAFSCGQLAGCAHDPRHRLVAPRDHNLFARFHTLDQLGKLSLGFVDGNSFGHGSKLANSLANFKPPIP